MLTTLAQLPRTIVLLLAPPDFSAYQHTPDPGPWCRLVWPWGPGHLAGPWARPWPASTRGPGST